MAIAYKELKRLIRYKLKDNNEIRFSDYDVKEAVNECIRYFNNSYALKNSDFLEKIVTLDEEAMNREIIEHNEALPKKEQLPLLNFRDEGIDLPKDFVSLQSIMRTSDNYIMSPAESIKTPSYEQYKITGNKLYLGCQSVKMLYKAAFNEVRNAEDVLEVPFVFKDALAKISCMILENNAESDVLMDAVNDIATSIVPRRRYANAKIKMPFKV